jgi:hypothetical protein
VAALLVDAVLVLTLLEAAFLLWRRRLDLLLTLLAGFFLVVALRMTMGGAEWPTLAPTLLAAGVAHGADLVRRWRG